MNSISRHYYFFIIFYILLFIYSFQFLIGPWDEYHLLYYFKNQTFFPFYDYNFPYYDAFLLGRFSPFAGQEFNIPIFVTSNINYAFIFVSSLIFVSLILYDYLIFQTIKINKLNYIFFFTIIIISSPGFYLLTTRLLYVEDTQVLFLIIFFISFFKLGESNKLFQNLPWQILLIVSTFISLLYKENNFLIIASFIFFYFIFDKKKFYKNKIIYLIIILLCLLYLIVLGYINLYYKNDDISYIKNENSKFFLFIINIFLRYLLNDFLLLLFILPIGVYGLLISKNIFIKSMFVSGLCNIFFFIILGLYGPYYLFPCYFLMFPLFFETFRTMRINNFLGLNLIKLILFFLILISFSNSIFYYFESKSLSKTFNNTVNYLVDNIQNKKSNTNIFMCNDLNEGNLAQLYILSEHLKYNDINSERVQFFAFDKNDKINFYTRISPFDDIKNSKYIDSIFYNNQKNMDPKKGDIILNLPIYSYKLQKSCSFLKDQQYSDQLSFASSFYNTLITNLIKVIVYKKKFVKTNFLKEFKYEIFKL